MSKPFAINWRPARFLSKKITFLEMLDMYLVVFEICCQYFVKIAKVTMGESPKQG